MSIQLIETEVRRLLVSKQEEVVCISGHWGVGKTYAWRKYLAEAKTRSGGIALGNYSYVSLFGINSLDELKNAIFENGVNSKDIGIEPSLETLQSNMLAVLNRMGKKALPFLQYIPGAKIPASAIGPLSYMSVKDTIVCIDDFERRGDKLAARDVLGLISNLKEQKKCKVVLILNDDAIAKDKEKADFDNYSEKVIDVFLRFAPSPKECVEIALNPTTETVETLGDYCIALGISNIRVIKKIERLILSIEPLLKTYEKEVLKQAIQTLVLLGWSVLEPSKAPPLVYLKSRRPELFAVREKQSPSESEVSWSALLDSYGFGSLDEFGLGLIDGVLNGFFDANLIEKLAITVDAKIKAQKSATSFRNAWDVFHNSFENNGPEVADLLHKASMENINVIEPMNLSATVAMLKELGKPQQAAEVLNLYIAQRGNVKSLFDINNNLFGDHINDPDVVQAFNKKMETFKDNRVPAEVLLSMSGRWNLEDISLLAGLSVGGYLDMFKTSSGDRLRRIIANCLQFSRITNASEPEKEIVRRAREALTQIAQESVVNALRVRKYGITSPAVPTGLKSE